MSDSVTVDTGATAQVAGGFTDAARLLEDPAGLLAEIAARVGDDATARAPRRTGALAGSMRAGAATVDGRPAAELTWGVRYAAYVNFGTGRMPARPFATDALAAATPEVDRLAAAWADRILSTI